MTRPRGSASSASRPWYWPVSRTSSSRFRCHGSSPAWSPVPSGPPPRAGMPASGSTRPSSTRPSSNSPSDTEGASDGQLPPGPAARPARAVRCDHAGTGSGRPGVLLALSLTILVRGGASGLSATPFHWPGGSKDVLLAFSLAVLAFGGFEAAAPLAEETRNPRRNVPMAVVGAVIISGIIYVVGSYALVTAFGVGRAGALA